MKHCLTHRIIVNLLIYLSTNVDHAVLISFVFLANIVRNTIAVDLRHLAAIRSQNMSALFEPRVGHFSETLATMPRIEVIAHPGTIRSHLHLHTPNVGRRSAELFRHLSPESMDHKVRRQTVEVAGQQIGEETRYGN